MQNSLETLRAIGKKLGPYLLLEILLPGGTMLALLLFLYRRGKFSVGRIELRTFREMPVN